ncbi:MULTISPECIES: TIM barrel protein [Corynebacterium]|uniref:TIM barrel protein n=1 Tax=unclassified Corynebacterium TaxID=2624378 RepID=UPI0008A5A91E|nr:MULTISPECIES: TIM barrel protein [unclassified Corynebacterium]
MSTIINCSTVYAHMSPHDAVNAARDDGYAAVEFWWPFDLAVPAPDEVSAFCNLFDDSLGLYAMNLWGGDMATGQRGVLDTDGLPTGHLEAVSQIARATGLKCSNVLLGRSGELTDLQLQRLTEITAQLELSGVRALIEPLSGMDDYPITDPWQAEELAQQTGAGVLADFYHFAANGIDVDAWLADVETGRVSLPAHVQIADFPGRGAPGTGEAPLRSWVERLRAAGYAGEVAGEWTL